MVSNKEIKIMLECKRKGLNPKETLQKVQVPYRWVNDICIFDFDLMPIDELCNHFNDLFENLGFCLDKGTILHGIYSGVWFKYEVEIYSSGEKSYLAISQSVSSIDNFFSKSDPKKSFDALIDKIKYLKPFEGYLVCDKCNEYYKLQPGEFSYEFTDKCKCGGKLKYYENIEWLFQGNNNQK